MFEVADHKNPILLVCVKSENEHCLIGQATRSWHYNGGIKMKARRNYFVRDAIVAELQTKPIAVLMGLPEQIADDLNVSRRAIEVTLSHLESEGFIEWTRKTRGGIRRPFYLVTVLKPIDVSA